MNNNHINFQTSQAAFHFNQEIAVKNAILLANNSYPGDGIIIGISENFQNIFQMSWLMRRDFLISKRIMLKASLNPSETGLVRVSSEKEITEMDYNLMLQKTYQMPWSINAFGVGNGNHTERLIKKDLMFNLDHFYSYKKDHHCTPLISGLTTLSLESRMIKNQLAIIKKSKKSSKKIFAFWNTENIPGYGHCIHTYAEDGAQLPSFEGEPYLVPLKGDTTNITDYYWELLNPISIVVKKISIRDPHYVEILIRNQNED